MTAGLSLVALRCRTADRTPARRARRRDAGARWSEARLGTEARAIGSPSEPRRRATRRTCATRAAACSRRAARWTTRLGAGRRPVLLAGDCSIGITTLPSALRHGPRLKVLWLDAHGDYNTPATSASGYLGGMALAGACGEWDAGLGGHDRAGPGGARRRARPRRGRAGAARAQRGDGDRREQRGDAGGGEERARRRARVRAPRPRRARPGGVPGAVPRARRALARTSSTTWWRRWSRTASWWASRSRRSRRPDDPEERAAAAETAMRVVEPFLDRLTSDRQSKE